RVPEERESALTSRQPAGHTPAQLLPLGQPADEPCPERTLRGIEALPGDEEEGRRLGIKDIPVASQHGDHPGRGDKKGLVPLGVPGGQRFAVRHELWILHHPRTPTWTTSKVRCVTGARVRGSLPRSGARSGLKGP